jgi:hypothetical protein
MLMPPRALVTSQHIAAPRASSRRGASPLVQRGQVILLTILVLLGAGVALFVSTASTEVTRTAAANSRTQAVLEQARTALIAYAVGHTFRPGALPCPDTNDDGVMEAFVAGECPSYIGRLPWRTLGVGDLRDEAGERLWYAVSPNFRDQPSVQINSDTKGNRTVFSMSPSTSLTTQAAAIVFGPGTVLPGQIRDTVVGECNMSGSVVQMRRDLCAANYLESQGGATPAWNNASAAGPFFTARPSLTFNDKLLVLRTTDLMPLVERRAARDLTNMLLDYRNQNSIAAGGCNCYPWPDGDGNGSSDSDTNRGRIPMGAGRSITDISWSPLTPLAITITTSAPHNFTNGQKVYLTDINGLPQLNGSIVTVTTTLDPTKFTISVLTTLPGAYGSGGRALPTALPHSFYRSISGITKANPAIVTATAPHRFGAGQQLYLSGIAGMTELNGSVVTVIPPITATSFAIDVNTSTYAAYTSGGTTAPRAMRYLEPNNWGGVIYYSVGKALLENLGVTCTNCIPLGPPSLSVNGTSGYGVVLITPGPIATTQASRTTWAQYIDDAENRDANPQPAGGGAVADPAANDNYVQPPTACPNGQCPKVLNGVMRCVASSASCPRNVTAPARDRLYLITAPPPYAQCGPTAQMLLNAAPCHTTGTNVKPVCQEAANNLLLGLCTCSAAATVMITPPCRNSLNPQACQNAVALLKACLSL